MTTDITDYVTHVHVDNIDEFKVVKTQEKEAEHYTSQSFVLPAVGNLSPQADYNQNVPAQILALDPLRKRAVISVNGTGACFLCHSQAQAQSLQFGPTQNADEASLVTAPFAFVSEATGPLWAVLASGVAGAAGGPVTASATFAAAAGATATLVAGASITGFDVTISGPAAAETQTVTVTGATGGTLTYTISSNGNAMPPLTIRFPQPLTPVNPAVGIAVVITGAAGTPAGNIDAYGQSPAASGSITVGVLQERRNA